MAEPTVKSVLAALNTNLHFDGFDDVALFRLVSEETIPRLARCIAASQAQLRQDLVALLATGFREGGYFVEIGATDGLYLSNTHILERQFGWSGLLVEPAVFWHHRLRQERQATIDTRCVHARTEGTIVFREVTVDPALSTIAAFVNSDSHAQARQDGRDYAVACVSLADLLREHGAPERIDYLSIDTEGSEFEILEPFDFGRYRFDFVTCEHNYGTRRNDILKLMKGKGYLRILDEISRFDDWFVHESLVDRLTSVLPDWETVSHQEPDTGPPPMTQADRNIVMLQETVRNLIVERDAYRLAMEERDSRLRSEDNQNCKAIEKLQATVGNLIAERDAYKSALNDLSGSRVKDLEATVVTLQKAVADLITDRDNWERYCKEQNLR